MPRSIWSGAITFGLVNVPVKLFSAAISRDVRFNQLHAEDGARIQLKRFCTLDGEEVTNDELVKGYEVSSGRYVVVTQEELESIQPKGTRSIEIEEFVELSDIDPVYFENSYYLVPDKGAARAYSLLLAAMQESKKVAIGKVVLRQKQYLAAIRPAGNALAMATLYHHDEVVEQQELDALPGENVEVNQRELTMARQLVESLSTDFEPDKFKDEYRERLMELIESKAAGHEITAPEIEAEPQKVVDLMAALEASIAAAREKSGGTKRGGRKKQSA